jgi:nitrile hydratase accessory protein
MTQRNDADQAGDHTANSEIANMDEAIALPRSNGELVFAAPWEARAFGLAVALNEAGVYPWKSFSQGLARQIAQAEAGDAGETLTGAPSAYYERWLATLEQLVVANGLVTPEEIEAMMAQQALLDDHDHNHDHGHDHGHSG